MGPRPLASSARCPAQRSRATITGSRIPWCVKPRIAPTDPGSRRAARAQTDRGHGRSNQDEGQPAALWPLLQRKPEREMHRAGGAFVHRLRELSASALRLPRTAPRDDFDLIALRTRCRTNLRHRGLMCKWEPAKDQAVRDRHRETSLALARAVDGAMRTQARLPQVAAISQHALLVLSWG